VTDSMHTQATTTVDAEDAARALARSAVEARVAACAQVVGPISSTYWWDDEVDTSQEWYVVFKTTSEAYPALEAHIKANHSYDVPEIIATPIVAGNAGYLEWITIETGRRV
jgi:periplasmic divalent cation tolerance protein